MQSVAAEALGELGNPRAVEPLINYIMSEEAKSVYFSYEDEFAQRDAKKLGKLLDKVGKEAAVEPLIPYLNCQDYHKQKLAAKMLRELGEKTTLVLLADVQSGDQEKIKTAVYAFISLGKDEIIPELIRILTTQGTKEMAETYLNCGQDELAKAAKSWASDHGFQISPGVGAHNAIWGVR